MDMLIHKGGISGRILIGKNIETFNTDGEYFGIIDTKLLLKEKISFDL
jgi:hypothetical protein